MLRKQKPRDGEDRGASVVAQAVSLRTVEYLRKFKNLRYS